MTNLRRRSALAAASADKAEVYGPQFRVQEGRALPIVGALLSSKASAVKRMSREDLPTPESPTKSTCEPNERLEGCKGTLPP